MDPVKKLVAASLRSQAPVQPHPDAELLSAFAENALSPRDREGVLEHLGACAACREVLFLALPGHSHTQKVLAVGKPRPRFAIRWATAAACVVIAAAVFVGRHELTRTTPAAQKSESPAGYVQPPTMAMEKAPAEMDAMRESQAPAKIVAAAPKALAEPKHITAKPSVALNFEQSGQVSVVPPASPTSPASDRVVESRLKDLPIQGRDMGALVGASPANAPTLSQNSVGQSATANERAYAYSAPATFGLAKQFAVAGVLGGTVVDPSGAVVANAKVTTVGPAGTKTITADADGKFSFDQLPAGVYSLKAAANGFKGAELQQVAVLAGKPSDVRVKLDVGVASETVEVSAGAVAVQTDAADALKLEANQSVDAARATTTESKVTANRKTDKSQLSRKKMAKARQAGGAQGAGSGRGSPIVQWTLSPEGAVQHSLDGGVTWQSVSTPDQASFRTLSAIGGDIWVGGKAGSLYHSADSGQQWTRVIAEVNGEKLTGDVVRVSFNDLQNGVISTSNGQLWATSDGGHMWRRK